MRRPVRLVYSAESENRSEASKEEYRIKHMTREAKMKLIGMSFDKTKKKS
jgi:predicted GIY-YIG superfamily endonuclease